MCRYPRLLGLDVIEDEDDALVMVSVRWVKTERLRPRWQLNGKEFDSTANGIVINSINAIVRNWINDIILESFEPCHLYKS